MYTQTRRDIITGDATNKNTPKTNAILCSQGYELATHSIYVIVTRKILLEKTSRQKDTTVNNRTFKTIERRAVH